MRLEKGGQRRDVLQIVTPSSNISYSPEFEAELAAQWRGYKSEDFSRLSGDEQSRIVAVFRLQGKIQAVMQQEQAHEARRKARMKPNG